MHANKTSLATLMAMVVIGTALAIPQAYAASKISPAETAIKAAANRNRFAVVTFYKKNDSASTKMLAEVKKLQSKHINRASFISVDVGNKVHESVISEYGADRSPIPLTIVIAPNGAVTAGYPNAIKKTDLSDDFVSAGMAGVLKILQDGKVAAICLQSSKTKHNKESLATAESLNSRPQFRGAVEVVKIDPSDRSEAKFMKICDVNTESSDAQLVIVVPPGKVVGKFDGAATTDSVIAALTKSLGGGCGGGTCAPGACGP